MHRKPALLLLGVALLAANPGCRSQQLAKDQDQIRDAVLDLQTNQIMDNLIRIRKGLPIIHMDYIHMTGTVTNTGNGTLGGSQTTLTNRFLTAPATAATIRRAFTNVFNHSASATQVNQLTLTAEPVTNSSSVYNAYLKFMKDPAHLIQTSEPPPPGLALLMREVTACGDSPCHHRNGCDSTYYWVPCEFNQEFFALSLNAVALRGEPAEFSPNFEVMVLGFHPGDVEKATASGARRVRLRFKIDKKIPNDDGHMVATIKGRRVEGSSDIVVLHSDAADVEIAQPGELTEKQKTSELILVTNLDRLALEEVDDLVTGLTGQKVGIRLNNFVPTGSQTNQLLEDIRYQLELNRLNQFPLIYR